MNNTVKAFRTKHLAVKEPGRVVQLHIRHGAGRLDFQLTTPLTIAVVVPIQKPRKPHHE